MTGSDDLAARRAAADELTRPIAEALAAPYRVPDDRLIHEPGVYDVPMMDYLADPVAGGSLSASGAKTIMLPAGPARLRWLLDHPEDGASSPSMDLGSAAHQVVLGDVENHLAVIPFDVWTTNAAKKLVKEARAAGLIPIKPAVWAQIQAMADAINANPTAAGLIHSAHGRPEQTMVWRDELSGVWCRSRLDWFRSAKAGHRLLIVDYKTTGDLADADSFSAPSARYGYYIKAAWYRAGVMALDLDNDPAFLMIVQETTPPYLVNVVELDDTALTLGRNFCRGGLNLYAECRRTGNWPGFSDRIGLVSLPAWHLRMYGEEPS